MDTLKEREVLYMQALKDGTVLDDTEKQEIETELTEVLENMPDESKGVRGLSESYISNGFIWFSTNQHMISTKSSSSSFNKFLVISEPIDACCGEL
ncbi:MAG: hypothetical protein J6P16_06020, partial [Eubacterium sp.]|nr:hypothetical protein [Eubacterium sp.]